MSTLKGLAVATALAGMMFSGAALADDDGSTTSVTEEGSVENLPDGSTVTTSTVTSITDTPAKTAKFGAEGDWVIGITRGGGLSYSKLTLQDSDGNNYLDNQPWELNFTLFVGGVKNQFNAGLLLPRWQFDTFIVENFSIGGGALVGVKSDTEPSNTIGPVTIPKAQEKELVFGVELKVGYNINFSDTVHWWPRVGLEFVWDRNRTEEGVDATILTETTFTALWLMVDAPFVFDLFPGFAVTLAPTFDIPLVGNVTSKARLNSSGEIRVDGTLTDLEDRKAKILNMGGYMGVLGYW